MKKIDSPLQEYLGFAKNLAFCAGDIIIEAFNKKNDFNLKQDNSPVTKIDLEINQLVYESIKSKYPDHGLMSEEASYSNGKEMFQWLCDPLDGTKAFILGVPNSMFMLALTTGGEVLLSVAYDPFSKKLYHAVRNNGAFCNDSPIHVSNHAIKDGFILLDASSFPFIYNLKQLGAQEEVVTGTGYKCAMIARGQAVGIIKNTADNYDIGPASLLVEESGGKVTALDGSSLRYDKAIPGVIISNGVVHDDLLQIATLATQGTPGL